MIDRFLAWFEVVQPLYWPGPYFYRCVWHNNEEAHWYPRWLASLAARRRERRIIVLIEQAARAAGGGE